MVNNSITCRPATKKDIPQLVALLNAQYKRKIKAAYFLWQYFSSCYPTILICALDKTRIIGMFGMQKKTLNNHTRVGQAIDMLIRPEYRGQGIFNELAEKAIRHFKKLDLLCVLPNLHGKNAVVKTLGWKNIGKLDNLVLQLDAVARNSTAKIAFGIIRKELASFQYTASIRNWRFDRNPTYKYYQVDVSPDIYAMVKTFTTPEHKEKYGDIVAINCPLHDPDKIKTLIVKACDLLIDKKVQIITIWALKHLLLYKILLSLGFKECTQERYFCIKILNKNYEYLAELKNWHLVQADTEFY
jgi:N-acetylglutamate synthase-like GNAT family acetyltransferase